MTEKAYQGEVMATLARMREERRNADVTLPTQALVALFADVTKRLSAVGLTVKIGVGKHEIIHAPIGFADLSHLTVAEVRSEYAIEVVRALQRALGSAFKGSVWLSPPVVRYNAEHGWLFDFELMTWATAQEVTA